MTIPLPFQLPEFEEILPETYTCKFTFDYRKPMQWGDIWTPAIGFIPVVAFKTHFESLTFGNVADYAEYGPAPGDTSVAILKVYDTQNDDGTVCRTTWTTTGQTRLTFQSLPTPAIWEPGQLGGLYIDSLSGGLYGTFSGTSRGVGTITYTFSPSGNVTVVPFDEIVSFGDVFKAIPNPPQGIISTLRGPDIQIYSLNLIAPVTPIPQTPTGPTLTCELTAKVNHHRRLAGPLRGIAYDGIHDTAHPTDVYTLDEIWTAECQSITSKFTGVGGSASYTTDTSAIVPATGTLIPTLTGANYISGTPTLSGDAINGWLPESVSSTSYSVTGARTYSGSTPYVPPDVAPLQDLTVLYVPGQTPYLPVINTRPLPYAPRAGELVGNLTRYNTGYTQFEGGRFLLNVGSLNVREIDPPDLSGLSLSVTSTASDVSGQAATTAAYLHDWGGWRYLSVTLNATTTADLSKGKEPYIYLGILLGGDSFTPKMQAYADLQAIITSANSLTGGWHRLAYDWARGGDQVFEVDLAAPLYNIAGEKLDLFAADHAGVGIPFVNTACIDFGPSHQTGAPREASENGFLALAIDRASVTASISSVTLITKGSGSILYLNSPSTTEQDFYSAQKYAVVRRSCEEPGNSFLSGGAPNKFTVSLVMMRDHKVTVALTEGTFPSEAIAPVPLSISSVVTLLNSLGNGYVWTYNPGDIEYDLTAVPFWSLLPLMYDVEQSGIPVGGSVNIPLAFQQAEITDLVPWWDKGLEASSLWYEHHIRGLVIDDVTGKPYTGKLSFHGGNLGVSGAVVPSGDTAFTVDVAEDGWFDYALPILTTTYLIFTAEDGRSGYVPVARYENVWALRLAVPAEAHSRYSAARNAKWVVETDHQGGLAAVLRGNYQATSGYLAPADRKRLGISGTSPCVVLDDQSGSVWVLYKKGISDETQVVLIQTKDQFQTVGAPIVIFANAYGEIAFCRDESTGGMVFIQTCGPEGTPKVGPQTTLPVNIQVVRYDGSGTQIPWTSTQDAYYTSPMVNTLGVGAANAGRPCVEVLPPHRIVVAYGDNYWYTDDGTHWYDQSGALIGATTTSSANNQTYDGNGNVA